MTHLEQEGINENNFFCGNDIDFYFFVVQKSITIDLDYNICIGMRSICSVKE